MTDPKHLSPEFEAIRAFIVHEAARRLRVDETELGLDVPLTAIGMDSMVSTELAYELEKRTGTAFRPMLFLECNTIRAVLDHIDDARATARSG